MKIKKVLFWSGGLSSLHALKYLLNTISKQDIILVTLLGKEGNEVGHTGIPEEIISLQAKYLGIQLIRLYDDELSEKVLNKLALQGAHFYSGCRSANFKVSSTPQLEINYPLQQSSYTEMLVTNQARAVLTSVEKHEDQRFLGKEISDIDMNFDAQNINTFVIYDSLFRIRIPFSKNIIVEKNGNFICKIRSV